MVRQAERSERVEVTPKMLEAMHQGEMDRQWLEENPGVLEPYRGQWVVIHKGRIMAHSPDGREVARAAPAACYSGALLEYVPTREEAESIHIYTPFFGTPLGGDPLRGESGTPSNG